MAKGSKKGGKKSVGKKVGATRSARPPSSMKPGGMMMKPKGMKGC